MSAANLPLNGIKIVEFSTMITASLATMTMAQQGAEVIKVEPLGIGDPMRYVGGQTSGISGLFHNCNRGKQSLALNLKSAEGVDIARRLCLDADVVIHNYRPGVMDRIGLGSASLRAEKPSLIYTAISGFGHTGPMSDAPAYDHVIQGMAGVMAVQGKGKNFAFVKMLICDKVTAYTAAQAVTAALFQRERTGEGQHIELSMLASCIAFMWPDGMMHRTLLADDAPDTVPFYEYFFEPISTLDGAVAFAAMSEAHWEVLFSATDRRDLAENPDYQTMESRGRNMVRLMAELTDKPVAKTTEQLLALFKAGDIPSAPCMKLEELENHPQIAAIAAVETADHPIMGPVMSAAAPPHFGGSQLPAAPPSPALGEHGRGIVEALGLDWMELQGKGVV
jgi:crotonobetainyl-CoA:carnitine CoA-transferase CaiB-like acyl-CoA transferase